MAPKHPHNGGYPSSLKVSEGGLSLPIGSVTGFAVAQVSTLMAGDIGQGTGKISDAELQKRGRAWLQH